MQFFRVLTGAGAGVIFIGVAKLISDLYPERFTIVFGIALFVGFCGVMAGTAPMVKLVELLTWRYALLPGGAHYDLRPREKPEP